MDETDTLWVEACQAVGRGAAVSLSHLASKHQFKVLGLSVSLGWLKQKTLKKSNSMTIFSFFFFFPEHFILWGLSISAFLCILSCDKEG